MNGDAYAAAWRGAGFVLSARPAVPAMPREPYGPWDRRYVCRRGFETPAARIVVAFALGYGAEKENDVAATVAAAEPLPPIEGTLKSAPRQRIAFCDFE
jgi:hypothetical protein